MNMVERNTARRLCEEPGIREVSEKLSMRTLAGSPLKPVTSSVGLQAASANNNVYSLISLQQPGAFVGPVALVALAGARRLDCALGQLLGEQ